MTPHPSVPRWQRQLLPGDLLGDESGRRSARDWGVDVAMLAIAVGIGALSLADTWDSHGPTTAVLDIALGVLACAALWVRRRHPFGVALLTVLVSVVSASAGGAGLLAVFNLAIRGSRPAIAIVAVLSIVLSAVFPLVYPSQDSYPTQLVLGLLLTVVAIGWGLFVRVRRELVHSLRDRAEHVESEHRLQVEQAREAERRRIAGEMHDVLAHRVSLLSLHAGALEFRPDAPPGEIAEAAGVIRANARAALEELREVIGVLREDAEADGPEPPQPTLAEIPALVEESRAAGVRVECRLEVADDARLTPALGRTAYRIVQEGLTNARKHAPDAAVRVAVVAREAGLLVEVVNRRPVGVAATPTDSLPGAGTGLIGLGERVALAGGELEHGPDLRGDFVLRATLPWRA